MTWNRIRSAEVDVGGHKSRVLLVSGPPDIVNRQFLMSYLDTKMQYQVDDVLHRGANPDGTRVLLEFRFGSFRCQAEAARMALAREFRDLGVLCEYGRLEPAHSHRLSVGVWALAVRSRMANYGGFTGRDPCDIAWDNRH